MAGLPLDDSLFCKFLETDKFVWMASPKLNVPKIVYSYGYGPLTMLWPAPRSGFGASVMYSSAEVPSSSPSGSGRQLGFAVSYGSGPWWIGYGYHQIDGNSCYGRYLPLLPQR